MLYYTVNYSTLWDRIDEELSHIADAAYSDDGVSLYDTITLTFKDNAIVNRFIADALDSLVHRTFDITKYAPQAGTPVVMRLSFDVPDFDASMQDAAMDEVTRYITLSAVTELLKRRRPALVPEYETRRQGAMDKAVTLLKSRKYPTGSW